MKLKNLLAVSFVLGFIVSTNSFGDGVITSLEGIMPDNDSGGPSFSAMNSFEGQYYGQCYDREDRQYYKIRLNAYNQSTDGEFFVLTGDFGTIRMPVGRTVQSNSTSLVQPSTGSKPYNLKISSTSTAKFVGGYYKQGKDELIYQLDKKIDGDIHNRMYLVLARSNLYPAKATLQINFNSQVNDPSDPQHKDPRNHVGDQIVCNLNHYDNPGDGPEKSDYKTTTFEFPWQVQLEDGSKLGHNTSGGGP